MSKEIEIEFKALLTKNEYDRVYQKFLFDKIPSQIQTNHYFETTDFQLKSSGAALRIREKEGKWKLTLKEQHPEGLLETHDELSSEEVMSWMEGKILPKPNVWNQLRQLSVSVDSLKYWGALLTERKEKNYKNTLLVLDYSKYNGHQDYELELEAKNRDEGQTVFNEIINSEHIKKRQTKSKIQRFFDTLSNR
jgi:uncharacterized protein YjbK